MNHDPGVMLLEGAKELGVQLAESQVASCMLYLSELKKWNRRINLTSILDDREIIIKHFLDSFAFLKGFEQFSGTALIDIGSGAGFPALALKIAVPELSVFMVESVNKKAAFLRHIIRMLQLKDAVVLNQRVSGLDVSFNSRFSMVTVRAFGNMEKAVSSGARFLRSGGLMILGRGPQETVDEPVGRDAGMVLVRVERFTLPMSDYRRAIWIFRRE